MIIDNFNTVKNVVYQKDKFFRRRRLTTRPDRKNRTILKNRLAQHDGLLKFVIIILLTAFAVYEFDYIYTSTSYFTINDMVVKGNSIVSDETLLKLTRVNIFDNIISADFQDVEKRLLSNPWIKDANVYRTSNNTVVIDVQERTSTYVTLAGNGKRYIISEDGVVLSDIENLNAEPEIENILISGLFPTVPAPGIKADRKKFSTAMKWYDRLSSLGFDSIKEISVGDGSNFYFRLSSGIKIFVNSVIELKAKLGFLKKILYKISLNKLYVEYIDLRVNRGLILKPY